MIDKLDLEIPYGIPFGKDFGRHWNDAQNDRIFKKTTGGMYLVSGDLRGAGIPARLSVGHKHYEKLGPKLEIIGAGGMHYSEWVGVVESIFGGDAGETAAILRADLTADVPDVMPEEFGRMVWCRHKHTNQQEFGEWDHKTTNYNRFAAQTLYYGRKPRQIRVYDKQLHRSQVLLPQLHRSQKRNREPLSTFEEAFGIAQSKKVTRVERQMGRRETAERWGIAHLGEIHLLAAKDPWDKLKFPGDDDGGGHLRFDELEGARRSHIRLLRESVELNGLDHVRAVLRGDFNSSRAFRKFWGENEHLILEAHPLISRAKLTSQYRTSILRQLAA